MYSKFRPQIVHLLQSWPTDHCMITRGNPDRGGDCSAVQSQPRNVQHIQATHDAFAAILADGSVVAWGTAHLLQSWLMGQLLLGAMQTGGDCSAIQDQLKKCNKFRQRVCAAILADGSVAAWGNQQNGGDCFAVKGQLRNVRQIQATNHAFAAVLADRSLITRGNPDRGGDCSVDQCQLRNVRWFKATRGGSFAAIL